MFKLSVDQCIPIENPHEYRRKDFVQRILEESADKKIHQVQLNLFAISWPVNTKLKIIKLIWSDGNIVSTEDARTSIELSRFRNIPLLKS
jgi:hypothetical protein